MKMPPIVLIMEQKYYIEKTFLKSSGGVIIEKLSEIENDYYSGDISEEETVEKLNGLLSLNTSNEEILNFKTHFL